MDMTLNTKTRHHPDMDSAYITARKYAVRRAAYLWEMAQSNPLMRQRCLAFGINPDTPLGPQVAVQP